MPVRKRGVRFSAKDLDQGRRYLFREEFVPILRKYLGIEPGQTVVDVGCGTGFFTRLVAHGLRDKGRIVGIDRNKRLLNVAKKLARTEGLEDVITFRPGSADSIPLDDGYADRVVCQTLLWFLKEPRSALKEMIRVCKSGGMVGAVEGAFDYVMWYVPDDPRQTALFRKSVIARSVGHRRLYGGDRGIGYKLPSMFSELGLKRVRIDGFPHVWMESDDRVPRQFKLQEYRDYVHRFENPVKKEQEENRRILKLGGMTDAEIEGARNLYYKRSKRILKNPSLLDRDFSVNGGLFLLTTGVKG